MLKREKKKHERSPGVELRTSTRAIQGMKREVLFLENVCALAYIRLSDEKRPLCMEKGETM
jgi:hypothetical protein